MVCWFSSTIGPMLKRKVRRLNRHRWVRPLVLGFIKPKFLEGLPCEVTAPIICLKRALPRSNFRCQAARSRSMAASAARSAAIRSIRGAVLAPFRLLISRSKSTIR
jgi:hypothetical protein